MIKAKTALARAAAGLMLFAGLQTRVATAGEAQSLEAAMGKALFKRNWVPAPSSTTSNDGLGPLLNARSCAQCHAAATAGRIESTAQGDLLNRGAVVRLSTPSGSPDPVYGAQIQTRSIPGHKPEATVKIDWDYSNVTLQDSTVVELRKPRVRLTDLAYGPLAADVTISLLLAPSLRIAAQIARTDASALQREANARAQGPDQPRLLGRKMTSQNLQHAIAVAFSRDLGLATREYPGPAGDCTPAQTACMAGPHGDGGTGVEISPEIVTAMTAYIATLPAPLSSASAENSNEGGEIFASIGCQACHSPQLPARDGSSVTLYSDLRLHDMGPQLAGVAEPAAAKPSEWRTAPLIGIAERLAAGVTLLHDGRARSIEEAILWHAGESQPSRENYQRLPASKRATLQTYLMSR